MTKKQTPSEIRGALQVLSQRYRIPLRPSKMKPVSKLKVVRG